MTFSTTVTLVLIFSGLILLSVLCRLARICNCTGEEAPKAGPNTTAAPKSSDHA